MKLLRVALERHDYNLAAHVLVYGLVKAKVKELKNGQKTRRSTKESKR